MATSSPVLPERCLGVTLNAGACVVRVHQSDKGPIWFGPAPGSLPSGRFDAPASEYRVCYCADNLTGAFVETVLRKANRIIAKSFVAQLSRSVLRIDRSVSLALLYGEGLVFHGVTNDICAGDDYRASQGLALAFKARGFDGLAYRARHNNNEICYALFDIINVSELSIIDTKSLLDTPDTIEELMRRHGAVWDPAIPLPPLDSAG